MRPGAAVGGIALALVFAGQGVTQPGGTAQLTPAAYFVLLREARQHLNAGNHVRAAEGFQRVVEHDPDNGEAWWLLGEARYRLKQYAAAVGPYEKSLPIGFRSAACVSYRLAQTHAEAGDKWKALEWLDRALAAGYERRPSIADDPAFAVLRDDDRFRVLAGRPSVPIRDRVQGWRADLKYLESEIKRVHYLYRAQPLPGGFAAAVEHLHDAIPSLSDAQIAVRLQGLVARLGDGHSTLFWFAGPRALPLLPLTWYLFSDGLWVVDAPDSLASWIGSRVVSIAGHDPRVVLERLAPFVSNESPVFVKAIGPMLYLRSPDFLREVGVISQAGSAPVTLEDRGGQRHTITLEAAPMRSLVRRLTPSKLPGAPTAPSYLRDVEKNYWFEPLPGHSAVYFQFNQLRENPGEPLAAFCGRLRRFLDEHQIQNLIVDARHNFGGDSNLIPLVLRTLIHFETSRPDARIYVLTSRTTFSAGQAFVSQVYRLTRAVFAGEPSSSRPNFVGEDTEIQLPYSGTFVSVSSRYHQSNPLDNRVWISPEIPVALTSAAYFANHDPVLEAVLQVIEQGRSR